MIYGFARFTKQANIRKIGYRIFGIVEVFIHSIQVLVPTTLINYKCYLNDIWNNFSALWRV